MHVGRWSFVAMAVAFWVVAATGAEAQYIAERLMPAEPAIVGTPERFAFELRGGPYTPNVGAGFGESFDDDSGPLLAVELDVLAYRIPYVGWLAVGSGIGWARYTGEAGAMGGDVDVDEETSLTLVPVPLMGVVRLDVLARELNIPFLVTGKLGMDFVFWSSSTGETDEGSGIAMGLRWGIQLALELDWFDRAAARALDEEWGINHSFVFGELFGSTASDQFTSGQVEFGDVSWAIGLGFIL